MKGSEEVASDAFSAGATDYIQKEAGTDQFTLLANRLVNYVERRRAQQERQRQPEIIENSKETISIIDEAGQFTYLNQACADLYGYTKDALVGRDWRTLYTDSVASELGTEALPQVRNTGTWSGITTGRRQDGSTVLEEQTLGESSTGELIRTVQDITDQ